LEEEELTSYRRLSASFAKLCASARDKILGLGSCLYTFFLQIAARTESLVINIPLFLLAVTK